MKTDPDKQKVSIKSNNAQLTQCAVTEITSYISGLN